MTSVFAKDNYFSHMFKLYVHVCRVFKKMLSLLISKCKNTVSSGGSVNTVLCYLWEGWEFRCQTATRSPWAKASTGLRSAVPCLTLFSDLIILPGWDMQRNCLVLLCWCPIEAIFLRLLYKLFISEQVWLSQLFVIFSVGTVKHNHKWASMNELAGLRTPVFQS